MSVFSLPEPLVPSVFSQKALYTPKPRVTLYCALAMSVPKFLFPKPPGKLPARCDVPTFFAATYFSDDEETAIQEFEYRYAPIKHRLWKGALRLQRCLDLTHKII